MGINYILCTKLQVLELKTNSCCAAYCLCIIYLTSFWGEIIICSFEVILLYDARRVQKTLSPEIITTKMTLQTFNLFEGHY